MTRHRWEKKEPRERIPSFSSSPHPNSSFPHTQNQHRAPAGKSLAFAPPKAAAGVPAAAGVMKKENDFTFRLQSVAGGAAAAPAPKKNALVEKVRFSWKEERETSTWLI